ncbi:hypothetical protein OPQ81_010638 [Rhizoctonia solani]|nr:hypothetical protein OPQ81_010638 [Rhizoctonia solani]
MFLSFKFIVGISLATLTSAAPALGGKRSLGLRTDPPSSIGICTQERIPINVQFDTTAIRMKKPASQAALTGFLANFWTTGSTIASRVISHKSDGKSGQVPLIIGTHGINFDHLYWEFGYSKEYNFIEAANKAGYAALTYDRFVISYHIQLTVVAARYPTDLDAFILTGYTPSMATVGMSFTRWLQTLSQEQPDMAIRSRWTSLPSGSVIMSDSSYLGTGSASADRFAFFADEFHDEDAFKLAYNTK